MPCHKESGDLGWGAKSPVFARQDLTFMRGRETLHHEAEGLVDAFTDTTILVY